MESKNRYVFWTVVVAAVLGVLIVQTFGATAKAAPPSVGKWDRFEAAVTNPIRYTDPYTDVSLDVTYTRPDNTTVAFWGFYDGGSTWKIRFMPDQVGTWRYQATFSDNTPGVSGTFTCVPSSLPGMISENEANPLWFGFKGGKPVLVRSLHVGDRFFAQNFAPGERTAFLNWAQKQGYNTLSVASHYLNRNDKGRGMGWETPKLWPLDAREYQKMEGTLNELARRRLLVYPFAGFFGRKANMPTDAAGRERFIRYTLARIGPYWNLLLNVGGPEPRLKVGPYLSVDEINEMGEAIKKWDVFGHLLSVHNPTGDDPFKDAPWISYGTMQGPKTFNLATLSDGLLKNHPDRHPQFAQETLWSGNKYHPDYSDAALRKNAYVINFSATAINFADNAVTASAPVTGTDAVERGDSSQGFSGTLNPADATQGRHDILRKVWDFMETVPFSRMRPRQDLVSGSGFCLADDGRQYLVYLPAPGTVSIRVASNGGDKDKRPVLYSVVWVNAQNTRERHQGKPTSDGQNLVPPAGGDDWLVHLVRK